MISPSRSTFSFLQQMASIEVSLGWKRRREALLETLPRAARDLVRELDTLHQALRDKDTVIQT